MTIPSKFKTQKEAKNNFWFSRRHETNEASQAHKVKVRAKRGKLKKWIKV